jgi:hypothetical protein
VGLTSLEDQRVLRAGTRAILRLAYRTLPDGQTAWARVMAATEARSVEEAADRLEETASGGRHKRWRLNRLMRAVRDLVAIGIYPSQNPEWVPHTTRWPRPVRPRQEMGPPEAPTTSEPTPCPPQPRPPIGGDGRDRHVTFPAAPPTGPGGTCLMDGWSPTGGHQDIRRWSRVEQMPTEQVEPGDMVSLGRIHRP